MTTATYDRADAARPAARLTPSAAAGRGPRRAPRHPRGQGARRDRPDRSPASRSTWRSRSGPPSAGWRGSAVPRERVQLAAGRHAALPLPAVRAALLRPADRSAPDAGRDVAVAIMLVAAIAACRRLGIPWIWLPLVLAWPPFAESIFGANVQTLLFAAFVFLFYRAAPASRWSRPPRDVADPAESGRSIGGLATHRRRGQGLAAASVAVRPSPSAARGPRRRARGHRSSSRRPCP